MPKYWVMFAREDGEESRLIEAANKYEAEKQVSSLPECVEVLGVDEE